MAMILLHAPLAFFKEGVLVNSSLLREIFSGQVNPKIASIFARKIKHI